MSQGFCATPVQRPEVDRFRSTAFFLCNFVSLFACHEHRRSSVDVLASLVDVDQVLITRNLSNQTDLQLRVVTNDQHVAGFSNKTFAILLFFRNLLQIRIDTGHAPCAHHLVVTGVNPMIGVVLGDADQLLHHCGASCCVLIFLVKAQNLKVAEVKGQNVFVAAVAGLACLLVDLGLEGHPNHCQDVTELGW